jgi:hypothetical protein
MPATPSGIWWTTTPGSGTSGMKLPVNGIVIYRASVPSSRPSGHFAPRIVPYHSEARIPIETPLITWPASSQLPV